MRNIYIILYYSSKMVRLWEKIMLKVFLSSTFRDLQKEREHLIKKISPVLDVVHMESFIPNGEQSQDVTIKELRGSDVVVFLISPYYGALLKSGSCRIPDCKNKSCRRGGISYTHCEYRFALAEDKPHMVYLVEPKEIKREFAHKYAEAEDHYSAFKEEIQHAEMAPEIHEINAEKYDQIVSGLALNIAKWYEEDRIQINDFYGRGSKLRELKEKIGRGDERVLVHGVGGIGKTTMIQVALLLQAMQGKRIVAIGPRQSYLSGSGYSYFRSSGAINRQETQQPETISLDDLAKAFNVPNNLKSGKEELEKFLLVCLQEEELLTFIDDFHLADPNVRRLVQSVAGGIILASKEDMPYGRQRIELGGVAEEKRMDMVRSISFRLDKPVDESAIRKIAELSEGYPVIMEILVNNYQNVNYDNTKRALQIEKLVGEEFLLRAVKSILSPEALETLQQLAIINPDLETNLDYHALWNTFPEQNIEELTCKSLLARREDNPDRYRITFQSIQQTVATGHEKDRDYHEIAVNYYRNIQHPDGKVSLDNQVEILYHHVKRSFDSAMVDYIIELSNVLNPQDYGHRRLVAVCEELIPHLDENKRAAVLDTLGKLYYELHIYEKAEQAFLAALEIYDKLKIQNIKG
jgi:hypothetical protein